MKISHLRILVSLLIATHTTALYATEPVKSACPRASNDYSFGDEQSGLRSSYEEFFVLTLISRQQKACEKQSEAKDCSQYTAVLSEEIEMYTVEQLHFLMREAAVVVADLETKLSDSPRRCRTLRKKTYTQSELRSLLRQALDLVYKLQSDITISSQLLR
ncbi:MAG: hypothetical protein AB1540_06110 [Bdellovibrionota bacterium]